MKILVIGWAGYIVSQTSVELDEIWKDPWDWQLLILRGY